MIKIKDIINPADKEKFNDVYIVYELMDTDLHQIIQSNQALTDEHCQVSSCVCLDNWLVKLLLSNCLNCKWFCLSYYVVLVFI